MIVVTQYGHTQLKKRDSYANNRHAIGIELNTQYPLLTIVEYIWFSQKSQMGVSLKNPQTKTRIYESEDIRKKKRYQKASFPDMGRDTATDKG